LRKLATQPATLTVLLAHAVFALLVLATSVGSLQWAELLAYDTIIAQQGARSADQPVVLVGASDADVETLNWPLTDDALADLLMTIMEGDPIAIGVDLYRSEPRPPGDDKLNEILRSSDRVFMAYKFPEKDNPGIPAPTAAQESGLVGFTDLVVDPGGIVRRALLFLTGPADETGSGLALQLATRYFAEHGICLQSDGSAANNLALGPCSPQQAQEGGLSGRTVIRPFEANDGGYVAADAAGYQVLLDYRNGFHPFPMVSIQDVLNRRTATGLFKDRIVIIGAAAESVKDFFFTPQSRTAAENQTSFGMEIHGHLVAQLLRYGAGLSKPITPLTEWQEIAWLWLWCMCGALVGFRIRSPGKFAAVGAAGAVTLTAIGYAALSAFLWLPIAQPVLGWLISAAVVTSYMSQREQQDRTALMRLFSQNVSVRVAEELWAQRAAFMDGNRPRPQRLVATVLFTDLKGFSSVSEGQDPTELMDWLNEYMTTMSRVIDDHGGVIDKFIGDAIMVVFGIPRKRDLESEISTDATAAVNCALAMAHELNGLNRAWRAAGKPEMGMRVGIHTGDVVAGALGGAGRTNYTVIGDTVNTAARLESFDKAVVDPESPDAACRIIISETTRVRIGTGYPTIPIGEVALKGKQQRVAVHLVRLRPPG
jgi:adenylate cyclase